MSLISKTQKTVPVTIPPTAPTFKRSATRVMGVTRALSLSPRTSPRMLDATPVGRVFRQRYESAPSEAATPKCASLLINPKQKAINKRVGEEFVLPEHMKAIASASKNSNFIVSFRAAGEATLHALKLGAPAKGHDILEKTIKKESLEKNYPKEQAKVLFQAVQEAGIWGYVGHWDKDTGALCGIYMGTDHGLGDRVKDGIYPIDIDVLDDGSGTFKIDMEKLNLSLEPLKSGGNWKALPFTGDYDMHDFIYLAGRRSSIPSNSYDEKRLIGKLNRAIANADPLRCGKPKEYDLIRHGAQVAYVAQAREKKERIVPEVAARSFPLAFVHQGQWTIINNEDEHDAFYEKIGTNMKNSWATRDHAKVR